MIALNDDGFPYMVPLNFGMDIEDGQLYLYFHCAMQGKKLDLIRKDNRATFEMDCDHNFILYDERMSCTMGYSSVVGHGIIEFGYDRKTSKQYSLRSIDDLFYLYAFLLHLKYFSSIQSSNNLISIKWYVIL